MNTHYIKALLGNIVFVLTGMLFICIPVIAQEDDAVKQHKHMSHQKHNDNKQKHGHKMQQHKGGHQAGGHHVMIAKDARKFPTTAYNETKLPRPVNKPAIPKIKGDPKKGKALAYAKSKGQRALSCLSYHGIGWRAGW